MSTTLPKGAPGRSLLRRTGDRAQNRRAQNRRTVRRILTAEHPRTAGPEVVGER